MKVQQDIFNFCKTPETNFNSNSIQASRQVLTQLSARLISHNHIHSLHMTNLHFDLTNNPSKSTSANQPPEHKQRLSEQSIYQHLQSLGCSATSTRQVHTFAPSGVKMLR